MTWLADQLHPQRVVVIRVVMMLCLITAVDALAVLRAGEIAPIPVVLNLASCCGFRCPNFRSISSAIAFVVGVLFAVSAAVFLVGSRRVVGTAPGALH